MKNTRNTERVVYKKRVLIYGDYNCFTGFSVVLTNILNHLRAYYKNTVHFDVVAINWYGDAVPDDYEIGEDEAGQIKEIDEMVDGLVKKVRKRIIKKERNDTTVYSAFHNLKDGDDIYGRNTMLSLLNNLDYDLLFMIQDLGVVSGMLEVIRTIKQTKKTNGNKQTKVIYYFPLDGAMIPAWFQDFGVIDKIVAYTDYARNAARNIRPDLKMSVILHGADTENYYPLEAKEKQEFREAYFGENANKKIITNINRNQHRKDIPTTILAFKEYKEGYNENSFLYLHMNPEDLQGWNLNVIMLQLGLKENEDYMFTPPDLIANPPEASFLNCIYNASDVFLTTTTGEGFGLTILEAMLAGVPVIAPEHTSIVEINGVLSKRIWTLDEFTPYVSMVDNMIRKSVHPTDVASKIDDVFINPEVANKMSINAREFAKTLNWNNIGNKWIEEFKKML